MHPFYKTIEGTEINAGRARNVHVLIKYEVQAVNPEHIKLVLVLSPIKNKQWDLLNELWCCILIGEEIITFFSKTNKK